MTMMATYVLDDRNQDATVYVGNLDERVTETILWELFLQGGPVVSVHLPKDRVSYLHQGFGFVEFVCEEDADYCIKIMNMIKLYGKPIRVNKASTHQKNLDVGANIFVGNLDTDVDEKLLYDTFSAFGVILQTPKIMRDYQMGTSKGFAFINYGSFEASDAAIEAMNGQFLCNRPITVSYAYKKDSKGERHGSSAERILAMQNPLSSQDKPHQKFADVPSNPNASGAPNRMPAPPTSGNMTQMPYLPVNPGNSEQPAPSSFPPPPNVNQGPQPIFGMPPPPGMPTPIGFPALPGMPPPHGMRIPQGMPPPPLMQFSGMHPPPGPQNMSGSQHMPGLSAPPGFPPMPGLPQPQGVPQYPNMPPGLMPAPGMPPFPGIPPQGMPQPHQIPQQQSMPPQQMQTFTYPPPPDYRMRPPPPNPSNQNTQKR